ncbi:MAG: DNA-binding NtrC family response regulator [Planctomycetota bacterium]|jgi:DNA-binding NtrC family response regulator
MPARILLADDDPGIRLGLQALLQRAGHEVLEAASGRETLLMAREQQPDLVLLDLVMPDGDGLEILPDLMELKPVPAVVVLTGFADVRTAVQAMRLGAENLLEKPIEPDVFLAVVERALSGRQVLAERDRLREELQELRFGPFVGRSKGLRRVLEHVDRVAAAPRTTALITGESGVGKELVARAIHDRSARSQMPFVALNCAALAESLIEAELFGYEAGAFTGGNPKGRDGLIHAAGGGTLFLDEVGELELHLQAKLLRVLQERTYRRIGGIKDLAMDVRVVASTNRDLPAMVEEGTFREDLFYRLNVLSIVMPPLRERPEDVPPLALHFLERFAGELARNLVGFTEAAMQRMGAHLWPGNVRELRNAVERASLLTESGMVGPEHLGLEERKPTSTLQPAQADPGDLLPMGSLRLRDMEEALIRRALDECDGNRTSTAKELGINRATLYNKLKVYGIGKG